MLRKSRHYNDWKTMWFGCSCHNSKKLRRKPKKSARLKEARAWKKDQGV